MPPSTATTGNAARPIDNPVGGAGMLEDARLLWHELLGHAHDSLHLAALETKLAAQSLMTMFAAAVVVAILVVSAWLGLVCAAVLALVGTGMNASIAVLIGVVANLLVALLLCALIQRRSHDLHWAATIRSLGPSPATQGNAGGG